MPSNHLTKKKEEKRKEKTNEKWRKTWKEGKAFKTGMTTGLMGCPDDRKTRKCRKIFH